jgi:NAD(P)-dependent dehydrogenase (short-subunit alcohol dehydrogenase family)
MQRHEQLSPRPSGLLGLAVRAFARRFRATHDRLDVLVHNAGAICL